jgi:acyl-CoA thioester hydrolase
MTAPQRDPLRHRLRVRYAECDQQGLVFNAHYLAWFDMNMTELWRAAFGSYQAALDRGVDIVVAAAELRFRASARFDDVVDLEVAVAHLGTTSIVTEHAVVRAGERLVEGSLRHVMVGAATFTKTPIPDWVRAGLAPWTRLDGDAQARPDAPG